MYSLNGITLQVFFVHVTHIALGSLEERGSGRVPRGLRKEVGDHRNLSTLWVQQVLSPFKHEDTEETYPKT